MIPVQLSELAALTGGSRHGTDVLVESAVVTDAREATPGSLYVARIGEHADGHRFVDQAREHGAVAALVTRPVEELPSVQVLDVQEAFARVARDVVDRATGLSVVGITGSSGKTSTKDLLADVLADVGPTVAPVGSYNSEVGVPLTVCRVTEDTRYLVAEMGADGVGHIAYLCRIAPPRIGLVLNVGSAHLGLFGSREAIARTKGELVEALPEDGVAVLNADDPLVAAMADRARARVVRVGTAADADVRASDITLDRAGRPSFRLRTPAGERDVQLGLFGEHQVGNALAVTAAALELGVDLDHVVRVFATARPASRWRMEVHERADGVTVVNDAYNANPESMRAALKALVSMGHGRRTWAVLGEMRELGEGSVAEHDEIGRLAVRLNIGRLVAVGEGARAIDQGARHEGSWGEESTWVPDIDAAHELLRRELAAGDVVLLKSSRDSGLRVLGDRLVEDVPG
ncbi:MAG TPA: UDP-N-acetylmuramoyl-tripeptide--D-alanyl-D-alanine ligase [Segeticoccus sp.]|nr:UDP-N-acetylmuramoyl-tripeptide--D-alanyl-D-alanine ligase [Segeticoccus sp.]